MINIILYSLYSFARIVKNTRLILKLLILFINTIFNVRFMFFINRGDALFQK